MLFVNNKLKHSNSCNIVHFSAEKKKKKKKKPYTLHFAGFYIYINSPIICYISD